MHNVADAGHQIVVHVHDEIVIDDPRDSGTTVNDICQLITSVPDWAAGLPPGRVRLLPQGLSSIAALRLGICVTRSRIDPAASRSDGSLVTLS